MDELQLRDITRYANCRSFLPKWILQDGDESGLAFGGDRTWTTKYPGMRLGRDRNDEGYPSSPFLLHGRVSRQIVLHTGKVFRKDLTGERSEVLRDTFLEFGRRCRTYPRKGYRQEISRQVTHVGIHGQSCTLRFLRRLRYNLQPEDPVLLPSSYLLMHSPSNTRTKDIRFINTHWR